MRSNILKRRNEGLFHMEKYEGVPKKMRLSSGGQAPCSMGFPHSVSVLGAHLYRRTSWHCCERLHSASVNFFEDSFNAFAYFLMGD